MTHNKRSLKLGFLSLFCFSFFSYINAGERQLSAEDMASFVQALAAVTNQNQPQTKGFKDTLERMVCNAVAKTASGLIEKGALVGAQEFCTMISRIKTTLENDSPLTIEEVVAINIDLHTCLKDYFSYSPKYLNKQPRANNIQKELKEKERLPEEKSEQKKINKNNFTEKEINDLTERAYTLFQEAEPHDWDSHRYNIISVIGTYIIEISKAKEIWIRKIAEQENFSAFSMIWYSAKNSTKAKKKYSGLVPRFQRIENNMRKLLELVLLSTSCDDLITRASDLKKYFNLIAHELELHAKLQGPLELAKLQSAALRFVKAGDSNEQVNNLLASMEKNSQ